jgi:Flp pilus assembly protein TadD
MLSCLRLSWPAVRLAMIDRIARCVCATYMVSDASQGRFDAALEDYSMATKLNPQHCRAYYNRAYTLDHLDRLEEAIADYNTAIKLEPGNATAYHNRGSLHERLGDARAALKGVRLSGVSISESSLVSTLQQSFEQSDLRNLMLHRWDKLYHTWLPGLR